MPRIDWDGNGKANLKLAKRALASSGNVADACALLARQGLDVSVNGLETAFRRRGLKSPGSMCGKNVAPKVTIGDSFGSGKTGHTLIISDTHHPYHDQEAFEVMVAAASMLQPDTLVINGDICDCYSVSFFDKRPDRLHLLKDETDCARRDINRIIKASRATNVVFCEGNHEFRVSRTIATKAPALFGLVETRELLLRDNPWVKWVPYRKHERIGRVMVTHEIGYCGKYAAQHTLAAAAHNIVFGHTHRGCLTTDGDIEGERHFSLNTGWGGDINQIDYMHQVKTKDWTLGMGHLYTDEKTGLVWPAFVPILNNSCHVGGKWVTV
jgi:predicted phosphodiesterase